MYDLTAFQRDALIIIDGLDEPNGLEIRDELAGYYECEIFTGRLYPSLDRLVRKGLIAKGAKNNRANKYTLTPRGRRELRSRREWENKYREIYPHVNPTKQ